MVDGIDGSGKGTAIAGYTALLRRQGKRIFDVSAYAKRFHRLPEPKDFKKHDVILSAEPTYAFIGRGIREEIVRAHDRAYSAWVTAQAFALDREILYRRVIIPALEQGKMVIQDRGVTTSLVYQPAQRERITMRELLSLSGNKLALHYRPDVLVIVDVDVAVAVRRLFGRHAKRDNAIFERRTVLQKLRKGFQAKAFHAMLMDRGTAIVSWNTSDESESETRSNGALILSESAAYARSYHRA